MRAPLARGDGHRPIRPVAARRKEDGEPGCATRPRPSRPSAATSCVVALLAVVGAGCTALPNPEVVVIHHGELLIDPAPALPPPDRPGWETVALPDTWTIERRRVGTAGWYRFTFRTAMVPSELWGVYLPRVGMNAAVYVNGELVGDGGPFTPDLARNWNRPLYFTVPAELVRAGSNEVLIRLETPRSSPGFLQGLVLGPDRLVARSWRWRWFAEVTAAQLGVAATLAMAALLTVLYGRRDPTGEYRWFIAGMLLWAYSSLDALVRDPPLPTPAWEWSTQTALNWAIPCFALAAHRGLGLRRPRLEAVILIVAGGGALVRAMVNPLYAYRTTLLWLVWTVGLGGYLVWLFGQAAHAGRARNVRTFQIAGALGLMFGIHDVGSLLAGHPLGGLLLSPYIPSLALLAIGWAMVADLGTALTQSEQLNVTLEQRVAEKHAELERNYARLRRLERDRAVTEERDRIMRDMHDGVGGQLVSTLAMVESGRFGPEAVADALHGALDDMRLVIDSLEPVEGDLLAILGAARERLEPRLRRHGIFFDWRVADIPMLAGFGPERALELLRLVQEAITNVVKHAQARTITIRTDVGPAASGASGVVMEVRDDGRGFDGPRRGGRGLANMRDRAARLGGELTVTPGAPGTVVRLWLPLEDPTRPA
jgi:signal transduction histidine kinase